MLFENKDMNEFILPVYTDFCPCAWRDELPVLTQRNERELGISCIGRFAVPGMIGEK